MTLRVLAVSAQATDQSTSLFAAVTGMMVAVRVWVRVVAFSVTETVTGEAEREM